MVCRAAAAAQGIHLAVQGEMVERPRVSRGVFIQERNVEEEEEEVPHLLLLVRRWLQLLEEAAAVVVMVVQV
jgi:hypothetical protein